MAAIAARHLMPLCQTARKFGLFRRDGRSGAGDADCAPIARSPIDQVKLPRDERTAGLRASGSPGSFAAVSQCSGAQLGHVRIRRCQDASVKSRTMPVPRFSPPPNRPLRSLMSASAADFSCFANGQWRRQSLLPPGRLPHTVHVNDGSMASGSWFPRASGESAFKPPVSGGPAAAPLPSSNLPGLRIPPLADARRKWPGEPVNWRFHRASHLRRRTGASPSSAVLDKRVLWQAQHSELRRSGSVAVKSQLSPGSQLNREHDI